MCRGKMSIFLVFRENVSIIKLINFHLVKFTDKNIFPEHFPWEVVLHVHKKNNFFILI